MIHTFDGVALRQLRTRRLRALLTAFGIVLGVGMVFGVLLLTATIRATFSDLITAAWGKSDLVVTSQAGGTMPDDTPLRLDAIPGVKHASPAVGASFTRLDSHGKAVKGAGGQMWVAGYYPNDMPYDVRWVGGRQVRSGPEIVVEKNWARDRHVALGQWLSVATPSGRARVHVVGIWRLSNNLSFGGNGLAGMEVSEARRLFAQPTGWQQIGVEAKDRGNVKELQRRVASTLGTGFDVKTPAGLSSDVSKQLQGLNVVLYFFSGIAIFVGCFLILNSFNMTVLQRMREIGTLRTLGATRGMVIRSVLVEALAIGVIGTILGLGLGLGLSTGLIQFMKSFGMPVTSVRFSAGAAIAAVIVGLVATVAGALWPARRAGRVPPVQAVIGGRAIRRKPSVRRALIGVVLFLPGLILGGTYWFSDQSASGPLAAIGGIGGTMLMFVGLAMAAPFLIMPFVRLLAHPMRRLFPTSGRLAADAARSNPARTSATAVALTIGLSVIVVNSAMSASFLGTISDQIDSTYARDFTVQQTGRPIDQGGGIIGPEVRRAIAAMPETAVATPVRMVFAKFPKGGARQGFVFGIDPAQYGQVDTTPVAGATRSAALAAVARGGVLIDKSYATTAGLHVGDSFVLAGGAGTRQLRVAGVLNGLGAGKSMQLSLATLRAIYGPTPDVEVLVKARSPQQRAALGGRIDAYLNRSHPNLESLSTAEVKDQIDKEINTQFNFFNAILAIAVVVSILGVVNTLAMSVLERTREIGVMRALGSSRWQVRRTMLDESLLITLSGGIVGVLVGTLIAFVWVQGLDNLLPGITFRFPVASTLVIILASVLLGALASILPARRAARLKPVEALNYE
jgi:putative ABC transport system permease protein